MCETLVVIIIFFVFLPTLAKKSTRPAANQKLQTPEYWLTQEELPLNLSWNPPRSLDTKMYIILEFNIFLTSLSFFHIGQPGRNYTVNEEIFDLADVDTREQQPVIRCRNMLQRL